MTTVLTPGKSMPRPSRSVAISTQVLPLRKLAMAAPRAASLWSEWMQSTCTPSKRSSLGRKKGKILGEMKQLLDGYAFDERPLAS